MMMRRLPREQWKIRREGDLVLLAADERNGAHWWTRFELVDLPNNDLLGREDLKRIGIEILDGRAVVKGVGFYPGTSPRPDRVCVSITS